MPYDIPPTSGRRGAHRLIALCLGLGALAVALIYRGRGRPARGSQPARGAVTQSLVTVNAADSPIGVAGRNIEQRLDEAVQETFPASDPIAICIE